MSFDEMELSAPAKEAAVIHQTCSRPLASCSNWGPWAEKASGGL